MSATTSEPSPALDRRLLLLRHAKSSWGDPGLPDFDRPLNARGRESAPRMGRKLHAERFEVDLILASTAQRVRETMELLIPAWGSTAQIVWDKHVYLATPEVLLELVGGLDDSWRTVMLVGHNPGLSQVASWLMQLDIDMPTAGLVSMLGQGTSWASALRERPWQQQFFWKPKELED